MSEPRFYVVEINGVSDVGGSKPTLSVSVLDRAYCHREVARFDEPAGSVPGEKGKRPKAGLVAWPREHAAAEAARLNAWAASA